MPLHNFNKFGRNFEQLNLQGRIYNPGEIFDFILAQNTNNAFSIDVEKLDENITNGSDKLSLKLLVAGSKIKYEDTFFKLIYQYETSYQNCDGFGF